MKFRPPAHPCDSCQRWSECNGVDAPNCPLVEAWKERMEELEKED